jgi:hypothetical protein
LYESAKEAELEEAEDEFEEFTKLVDGSSYVRPTDNRAIEYVPIELWLDSKFIWDVYKLVRQYVKPVYAGMAGVLVGEGLDAAMLFGICDKMKLKKKKVLEVVEMLPYLHNTVLSRKLKREAKSDNKTVEDTD